MTGPVFHNPNPIRKAPPVFKPVSVTAQSDKGPMTFTSGLVTDESFAEVIGQDIPVCVFFTIPGCGSCSNFKNKILPEALAVYQNRILFYEFSCSMTTKMDKEEDVHGHPNLFFYLKGKMITHQAGAAAHFEYMRGDIRAIAAYKDYKLEGK